jgi:hypothetical protein
MSREPDWSRLPDDPLSFFELPANPDRKSLKRAYGALIKQYRPETHPAQFQKIREAYEILENQIRYGVEQSMLNRFTTAWEQPARGQDDKGQKKDLIRAVVVNDFDSAIADPDATYRRLRQNPSTPQDYFLLATLSDLLEPAEKQMYLKWILTGVRSFPRDPGLLRLLTEYLTAFADTDIAFSTLITLSKLISGDEYFQVTESLWLRLLQQVPFETWAKALQKCEDQLKFRSIRPRLAFIVATMRRALWVAPPQWISARKKFIDQHGSEIDQELDEEVEQMNSLIDYYQNSRPVMKGRPMFSTFDQLIETYCRYDFEEARPKIAAICDEIARNSNAMAETFPTYCEESELNTLMLISRIAYDTATESGLSYPSVEDRKIQELADSTVMDISGTIHALAKRLQRMRFVQFVMPFCVLAFAPMILIFGMTYWALISIIWFAIATALYFGLIRPRWLSPKADEKSRRLVLQSYENQWRPRLFRYVQACHAPASRSIQQLAESGELLGEKRLVEIALSFAEQDAAIQVFSRMQLFLH